MITEELIPLIKECRRILDQKQEMDEEYAVAEKLMEGLIESCIYLFGTNKEFMKELDKMEEKFYFQDEKLAMAQERIGVLEVENASVREENNRIQEENNRIQEEKDRIQEEKDRIQEEKDEVQKKYTELERTVEELNNTGYMRFVHFIQKWRNYMFL